MYSHSLLRAEVNVSLFFIGMMIAYDGYVRLWPWLPIYKVYAILAYLCWYGKGKGTLAMMISDIILGVLFSEGVLIFYSIRILSILSLIAWLFAYVFYIESLKNGYWS